MDDESPRALVKGILDSIPMRAFSKPLAFEASIASLLREVVPETDARMEFGGELGRGGMGSVVEVTDRGLKRPVALKQLREDLAGRPAWAAALVREARLTARLQHPSVLPVYDIGVRNEHRVYYTMKLVEGRTLAEIVQAKPVAERTRTELLDQLDAVIQVCGAVATAHEMGIAHCDIKPHNIMIGGFGAVYLMDWGGARPFGQASRVGEANEPPEDSLAPLDATDPSWINDVEFGVGTPAFMAPEQANGEPVDGKTDVFALGSVLYYIVTGRSPFARADAPRTMAAAKACEFPRPASLVDVSEALEAIVLQAMARDPQDRYASASELAEALKRFERGGGLEFPILEVEAGERIIREGEIADTAYIIIEGRCEVFRDTPEGGEERLRIMEADDVFGETAIFAGLPRTASVRALEPTRLYVIRRQVFETEIERWNPQVARFVETLARRLAG